MDVDQFIPKVGAPTGPEKPHIEKPETPKVLFEGVSELPVWDMKKKISEITKLPGIRVTGLISNKQSTQGSYNGIQFDSYWEFAFFFISLEDSRSLCYS